MRRIRPASKPYSFAGSAADSLLGSLLARSWLTFPSLGGRVCGCVAASARPLSYRSFCSGAELPIETSAEFPSSAIRGRPSPDDSSRAASSNSRTPRRIMLANCANISALLSDERWFATGLRSRWACALSCFSSSRGMFYSRIALLTYRDNRRFSGDMTSPLPCCSILEASSYSVNNITCYK